MTHDYYQRKILEQQQLIMSTPDGFEKRKELAELTLIQAAYIQFLLEKIKTPRRRHSDKTG